MIRINSDAIMSGPPQAPRVPRQTSIESDPGQVFTPDVLSVNAQNTATTHNLTPRASP